MQMLKSIPMVFIDEQAASGDETAQQELLPQKASAEAAGYDLVAANIEPIVLESFARALIPTGIAIALPRNYEAQIRPRSGLALKNGITVLNAPGTIDADYRGEIKVILINFGKESFTITRGMRIAQMVIASVTSPQLTPCFSLSESLRGTGGFGSTGVTC